MLKKINEINNIKFFDFQIRQGSIFVIFCYNKKIDKNFKIKIDANKSLNLFNLVNFVALKNGKHDQKGFVASYGEFGEYLPPENSHVKELFNSIKTYFEKK